MVENVIEIVCSFVHMFRGLEKIALCKTSEKNFSSYILPEQEFGRFEYMK